MMNDIKLKINTETVLFFDLDGTLIDTDFANFLSFKDAIKSVIGLDKDIDYNPNERFNRSTLKKMFPNFTNIEFEKIIHQKELNYSENLSKTTTISLTTDILTYYAETNMTVLVTNCREERALITLNYHNLKDKFSHIFFRKSADKDFHINKFESALTTLGLSPESVIVFENEAFEIEEAVKAGIPTKNIISIV
ncbi:MAG: hypothetical protein EAZ85_03905 [Bacteroidetes bacterium]|nr:MAG: hypothetical protein EAZ85_03905 [Bacteroidota bacterium]